MRRILVPSITLALVLSGRLALPSEARAQYLRPLNDTIATGVTLGAGLGAPLYGGFEIGGTLEIPVSLDFRFRGDAASGIWQYTADPYTAEPSATFVRHRILGSLIRPVIPVEPGEPQARLARLLPWIAPMTMREDKATAYVCRDFACEQPVTSVADLTARL